MKMIKVALLGTAALAAVSVSARADNLSDLKAQIEALNARVAAVETAPAIPAGFSLMTVSTADALVIPGLAPDKNYGKTATQIGIVPTADVAAAPTTVIQWSGFVRAALVYSDGIPRYQGGTAGFFTPRGANVQTLDVMSRAEIKVAGKTDTAVGEVGATVKLRASLGTFGGMNRTWNSFGVNGNPTSVANAPGFVSPGYWGYWKMTPELTLGGGLDGSLAGNAFGYDGACTCVYTDNAWANYGQSGDPSQMRLTYASGPMSFAVALEDYANILTVNNSSSSLGVAGEFKYSGDTVSGEVSAGYWARPSTSAIAYPTYVQDAYIIDAGLGFALGDMAKISMAAGFGSGHLIRDDYWKASILGSVNLSSAAHAELAYSHVGMQTTAATDEASRDAVMGGIYYDPVSQLTIGVEGEWIQSTTAANVNTRSVLADLVTIFRF